MADKASKLVLSFDELRAVSHWLLSIMENSRDLAGQSVHYRIQLSILGTLLQKKVYPKTLIDGGQVSIKLQAIEWMAVQCAIYNGWNYSCDLYVQNVIRNISMNKLPNLMRLDAAYLVAPDAWEEE